MTISWSPPEAASDPTTERPALDRNRVLSVCAIVSLFHLHARIMRLERPTADRGFTVLPKPLPQQLARPADSDDA
jgi:hypothetical protein